MQCHRLSTSAFIVQKGTEPNHIICKCKGFPAPTQSFHIAQLHIQIILNQAGAGMMHMT